MNPNILCLEKVSIQRGGRQILQDVSLEVGAGDRIVIQGDNGSGKTTLLRTILGLLPLASGTIRLQNKLVGSGDWKAIRRGVAWVPQEGVLHRFPVAAREVAAVGLAGRSMSRKERALTIDEALSQAGAAHLGNRCFHRLSGGERQRISIARCLAQGADLLLLDEPSAALDADSRKRLVSLTEELADKGRTFIVVTHDKELFNKDRWTEYHLEGGKIC